MSTKTRHWVRLVWKKCPVSKSGPPKVARAEGKVKRLFGRRAKYDTFGGRTCQKTTFSFKLVDSSSLNHHSILPTRLDDLFRFWFVSFFEPAPLTCPCKFAADAAAAADAVFGKLGERPLEDAAVDPPGLRLILTP